MPSVKALQIIADLLGEGGSGADLPTRLCDSCLELLDVQGAGLSLSSADGKTAEPTAAANNLSLELEQLQFSLGEGPCLDAVNGGKPVLMPDLRNGGLARWPHYSRATLDLGILAVFSFPLQIGSIRLGALDVYRGAPGDFSGEKLSMAVACADAATTVFLHLADETPLGEELQPQMFAGPGSQRVVHQATGMISVQASVSMADALLLLRARAFSEGRPIHAIAEDVVARAVRFSLGSAERPDGLPPAGSQN